MEDYKYLAIVEWVKKYIAEEGLQPDDRFLTEKELCAIHGVSRQTVRQALMKLERDNVLTRVRGSGTFVKGEAAKPGAVGANTGIGVISTYFSDYIFPHIVTGIESVLNDVGCPMQLAITHNLVSEETKALRSMIASGVRGLIVEPSKSALPNPNIELYRELQSRNIPIIFFNAKYPWSDIPFVAMNDESAGRMMTDYLFDCGHTKICGIFVLDDIQGHKRYRGFMDSFSAHGRGDAEKNVMWYSSSEMNELFAAGKDKLIAFLSRRTGVVCYNDMLAVNLLRFCRENGISVPDDLSVTGIDDSKYSSLCDVPLTTARHPQRRLGIAAAKALLGRIEPPGTPMKDILFEPELVVRSSVKKLTSGSSGSGKRTENRISF